MAEVSPSARISFLNAFGQASILRRIVRRENVVAAQVSMSGYGSADFLCVHQLILHGDLSTSFAASSIGKLLILFCTVEQMAAHRMGSCHASRFGITRAAYGAGLRAARMEMAAGRRIRR